MRYGERGRGTRGMGEGCLKMWIGCVVRTAPAALENALVKNGKNYPPLIGVIIAIIDHFFSLLSFPLPVGLF